MKKRGKLILGIIQVIVAVGAIPAGYSMIVEPDGTGLGMTTAILKGSPFKDFFIPGLFLFLVNGILNLAGAVMAFLKYKHTWLIGLGLGSALIIWILVQIYSVGLTHFLQPVYFITGIIEIVVSIFIFRSREQTS